MVYPFTIAGGNPIPDKIGGLTTSHDYVVLSRVITLPLKMVRTMTESIQLMDPLVMLVGETSTMLLTIPLGTCLSMVPFNTT